MNDIAQEIAQARALLSQSDNTTHRRDLSAILTRAASDQRVSEGQRVQAAAMALLLAR